MVLDRNQVEAAIERALELDAAEVPAFDVAAVQRLADELGVSQAAISQAIGEAVGGSPGPLNATAQAPISAPPAEVEEVLHSYFRLRGLGTDGSTVWRQESGWWPDLYRFTATTPVAAAVAEAGEGTMVRLTARLDRVWRAHVVSALFGPLLLAIAVLTGAGPSALLSSLLLSFGWVAVSAWAYQLRRESIRRRLAQALHDVSQPAYRLAPW